MIWHVAGSNPAGPTFKKMVEIKRSYKRGEVKIELKINKADEKEGIEEVIDKEIGGIDVPKRLTIEGNQGYQTIRIEGNQEYQTIRIEY